jgi:hypothetical protein
MTTKGTEGKEVSNHSRLSTDEAFDQSSPMMRVRPQLEISDVLVGSVAAPTTRGERPCPSVDGRDTGSSLG